MKIMKFLKIYYRNILQYEFLNKFNYLNIKKLPKLVSIILKFDLRNNDFKSLINVLIALELISKTKSFIILSKNTKMELKIVKGTPIGCKVILRNNNLLKFLNKLLNKCVIQNSNTKVNDENKKGFSFSFKISNLMLFEELEYNYIFFKSLSSLSVTFITTAVSKNEFIYLLNSYKIKRQM